MATLSENMLQRMELDEELVENQGSYGHVIQCLLDAYR